jgi:galactitol-specific phosphotransferase system IIB component
MRELRVLLVGSLLPAKFVKVSKELQNLLAKEDIKAVITTVNVFDVKDISVYEDSHDVVLFVSTGKLESKLPVVGGMGLVYAWMDREKMIQELKAVGS